MTKKNNTKNKKLNVENAKDINPSKEISKSTESIKVNRHQKEEKTKQEEYIPLMEFNYTLEDILPSTKGKKETSDKILSVDNTSVYEAQSDNAVNTSTIGESKPTNINRTLNRNNSFKGESNARDRVNVLRKLVDGPKVVGNPDDIVPFSWKQPLKLKDKSVKMSRVFKTMTEEASARAMLVPARSDQN